jgi:hypothetical protein
MFPEKGENTDQTNVNSTVNHLSKAVMKKEAIGEMPSTQ